MPADPELRRARRTTHRVARTFGLACRLLPRAVRDDVYRLYLVFRTLDDLVDEHRPEARARVAALVAWSDGGPADTPETRTLAAIDRRIPLPREALRDFAAGMRFDLDERPITTESELETYCYRVAGTIGLVMNAVLGGETRSGTAAVALGSAMQLTNILRDVDEDGAAGRHYLPVGAAELAPGRRGRVMARGIDRADSGYVQGLAGVADLTHGRTAIRAAAAMYREILRQIERDRRDVIPGRSHVSLPRKLWVVARALAGATPRPAGPSPAGPLVGRPTV